MEQTETTVAAAQEPALDPVDELEQELDLLARRARRAGFVEAGHFIAVALASIAERRGSPTA